MGVNCKCCSKGGKINYQHTVIALECDENTISSAKLKNNKTSEISAKN